MDLELLDSLGWREGLIAIIGLLVLYIVVLLVRMRRLQRERQVPLASSLAAQSAVATYSAIQNPVPVPPTETASPVPLTAAAPESTTQGDAGAPQFPWNEPPPGIPPGQGLIAALQREVYQLRCEVDGLRSEVLAARDDFRRQLVQSEGSAPGPSPLYNDAMQMAVQGHDATTIAHHCGIARAEADLVVALARNRSESL
ncbi:conserved hypothetical protein [Candidatus Accumulibacter aalborgensis]|uniref:DUF2802 domain-containing protein n=1 Tax=Candidatus Accumulibacter aalborgensis TaxID=1860102 RepID=A0A1A8XPP2_9PROT|nr:DUF2802 domain-containing protein [Candidatus Accumulibacter aalborgensis]SBT07120.1 conserved hypothetical protein [Candidatus Accumulibacter aalborgensis]